MKIQTVIRKFYREFCSGFLRCGVAGWCMEILFTALGSVNAGDFKLMGRTSLFMFPIYGLGAFLGPLGLALDGWIGDAGTLTRRDRLFRHGINGMVLIFTAEYLCGTLLRYFGVCPWDYTGNSFSIDGLIRLDFAPCWFAAALIFEHISAGKGMRETESGPAGNEPYEPEHEPARGYEADYGKT